MAADLSPNGFCRQTNLSEEIGFIKTPVGMVTVNRKLIANRTTSPLRDFAGGRIRRAGLPTQIAPERFCQPVCHLDVRLDTGVPILAISVGWCLRLELEDSKAAVAQVGCDFP